MNRRVTWIASMVGAAALLGVAAVRAGAPPNRYTYPIAGVVHDTMTGLTWQQGIDPNHETFAGANAYCAGLGLAGGGWRLPSIKELQTLVDDVGIANGQWVDPVAFPNSPQNIYWSSTLRSTNAMQAWTTDGFSGSVTPSGLAATAVVRCVR